MKRNPKNLPDNQQRDSDMSTDSVVIVSGVRTPMGGFQGSLAGVSATDLGATPIAEAVKRAGLQPAGVQEVIMGSVLPAGLKQGPAHQAMRKAGYRITRVQPRSINSAAPV